MILQAEQTESWVAEIVNQLTGGRPLLQLAAVAVVLLLMAVGIAIVRFVARWSDRRIETWKGTRLRPIRWQSQELFSEEDTTNIVRGIVRWIGYLVVALVVYTALQLIFLVFPQTRGVGEDLLTYLAGIVTAIGTAIFSYLPSLLFLIILYYITSKLIRLIELVFRGIAVKRIRISGFHDEWAKPTFKIFRILIWAFFIIVAFPYLPGAGSPAFQGVSIFLGVLLSLGGSGAVANVVAGTVITYMRPFRIGDRVRIADAEGDVVEKTMFVTRVRTVKNVVITIPNALVMNNHIINYSLEAKQDGITLHTTVTIGYDVPWTKIHEALVAAAKDTGGVEAEPEPFVLQTSLDDFTVAYELNATTREPERMTAIYSDLHRHIQDRCHEAGIEIASPTMMAVRDGNAASIPEGYLPKDYKAPGFRFLPLPGTG